MLTTPPNVNPPVADLAANVDAPAKKDEEEVDTVEGVVVVALVLALVEEARLPNENGLEELPNVKPLEGFVGDSFAADAAAEPPKKKPGFGISFSGSFGLAGSAAAGATLFSGAAACEVVVGADFSTVLPGVIA